MIELLWDAGKLGTANTSFGTLAVGDPAGHSPRELLETAVAGCMMQALLEAASAARIPILGYIACATLDRRSTGMPCVRLRGCVVGPATVSQAQLSRVTDEARQASPVAGLLGDGPDVEWDLRILVAAAEDK
jgi:uncharacterized OsmC-like protein